MNTLQRTTSAFPLAIGTSIALEALYDPRGSPYDPKLKITRVNLDHYDYLAINIRTLIRNVLSSLDKEVYLKTDARSVAHTVKEEIAVIEDLNTQEGQSKLILSIYDRNYPKVLSSFSNYVMLRKPTTKRQIHEVSLIEAAVGILKKEVEIDNDIQAKNRTLLLSHLTVDLLLRKQFSKLGLLESHTGRVKGKEQWSSKYVSSSLFNVNDLPFTRKLLFLFGSKDNVIMPYPLKTRKGLMDIFTKNGVTPHTTESKITMLIDLYSRDLILKNVYKEL